MPDSPTTRIIAQTLAGSDIDLGDEREVIRFLTTKGFGFGDIVLFCDEAIERARMIRANSQEATA